MTPLLNSATTWSRLAALLVILTQAMGASRWSWTLSLSVAALLVSGPLVLGWIVARFGPKAEGSPNGGDVILTPGAAGPGGVPGKIVMRGFARSSMPFLSLEQADSTDKLDIYVGAYWPMDLKAKDGSVFVKLDDLRILRRESGVWNDFNRQTTGGDSR
jgi:hypothetical protein